MTDAHLFSNILPRKVSKSRYTTEHWSTTNAERRPEGDGQWEKFANSSYYPSYSDISF